MLRPQDLLVTLKLAVRPDKPWIYRQLAEELAMSTSETYEAVQRAHKAGLLRDRKVAHQVLLPFLEHGVRVAFYAERGPLTRGLPTGVGASPLSDVIASHGEFPVWPDPKGTARGYALEPLYRSVPAAARNDARLYELLALIDALRDGGTRERKVAMQLLKERLTAKPRGAVHA